MTDASPRIGQTARRRPTRRRRRRRCTAGPITDSHGQQVVHCDRDGYLAP